MFPPSDGSPAESSTATIEVPTEPKAYQQWRQTGEVTPKAAPAPAPKKTSDAKPADAGDEEGDQASGKAPESEPGKKQEHKPSKAEARLNELLDDIRKTGYTPSELKLLRKEAQKGAEPESKPKEAPEKTVKPADEKAPKKPQEKDFKTWEEYEAAKDSYLEEMADYKAQKRLEAYQSQQRQEAAQKEMQSRLDAAKARYGDGSDVTIVETAKAIFQDQAIPGPIREVLNESDVLIDVLYTLGKDSEGLAEFLELAKSKPGAAMRKAVLIEKLVSEELAKGGGKPAAGETPERNSDGKFVSTKPPEKKNTSAPPPPKETSGRSGPPADEVEGAVKSGDFASYRAAANRRDLARLQGR
jgi:hypothetical protein